MAHRKSTMLLLSLWTCSLAMFLISTTCLETVEAADSRFRGIAPVNCPNYREHADRHRAIAAELDRVCEDCYNLYRAFELYSMCKENCYKNDYFPACLKSLSLDDEVEEFQRMIILLNNGDPDAQITNFPPETTDDSLSLHYNDNGPQRFKEIGCMGSYNKSIFCEIDRICDDCAVFWYPSQQINSLCREHCYANIYYTDCLQSLKYRRKDLVRYKDLIERLSGYKLIRWRFGWVGRLNPTTKD